MTPSAESICRVEPTPGQALVAGIVLGTLEPILPTGQPCVNIKNWLQTRVKHATSHTLPATPFPGTPNALFAGSVANIAGSAPVTAVQMVTVAALKPLLSTTGLQGHSLEVTAAATGGVVGALVATPFEVAMVKMGQIAAEKNVTPSYGKLLRTMYTANGIHGFMKGYWGIAARDAVFVTAYSEGGPVMKAWLRDATGNDTLASAGGPIIAGSVGALASQHFDTWKTRIQSDSPIKTGSFLIEGARGAFPRVIRIAAAVALYNWGESELVNLFNNLSIGTAHKE